MFHIHHKKSTVRIGFFLFFICLLLFTGTTPVQAAGKKYATAKTITKKLLNSMNLKDTPNLMIVAHPDDETLWGGGHLFQDNYLIVCLTNANTPQSGTQRAKEFRQVIQKSGNKGIIMYYPDYKGSSRKRDNWSSSKSKISKDIMTLLRYKKWETVVTYDAGGAYGHKHHKMTCSLVTKCFKKCHIPGCSLYYFEKYHTVKELDKMIAKPTALEDFVMEKKEELLDIYWRRTAVYTHEHMMPYENWTLELEY